LSNNALYDAFGQLTLLQTEQTLFQAEDTLALVQLARLQAIVSLYQALGSGWSPEERNKRPERTAQ
jgi:outer membrane protein TolC